MPDRKPPRMRAACGHCHAAKVKCSGDKSGCTRCLKLGLRCEYGVSMVGRASKKKGSSNNNDNDVSMTDASSGLPLLDTNPADAFSLPLGEDFNFNFAPQDLMSIAGLNDFSFHAFPDNTGGHTHDEDGSMNAAGGDGLNGNKKTPATSAVPELSMAGSSINGDSPRSINQSNQGRSVRQQQLPTFNDTTSFPNTFAANLTLDPSSANTFTTSAFTSSLSTSTNNSTTNPYPQPNTSTNSKTVPELPLTLSPDDAPRVSPTQSMEPIFCFARLSYYLERHLGQTDDPLDRTLTVVRSGLRELMELVKWDGVMVSYGCRALIFACLTLIVKLYSKAYQRHRSGFESAKEAAEAAVARNNANGAGTGDDVSNSNSDGETPSDDDDDGSTGPTPLPIPLHLQPHSHSTTHATHSTNSSSSPSGPTGGPSASSAPPPMRFGAYEIDPADQLRIQNQVIASELGRCVAVIKAMARETTRICERGPNCQGRKNFEDLAQTATMIRTQLEEEKEREKAERERVERAEMERIERGEIGGAGGRRSGFDRRMVHPLI